MRYAIVIEHAGANYSAYAPNLPGCVATGESVAEVERNMREAIEFHLSGLREYGSQFRRPQAWSSMSRSRPEVIPSLQRS